METEIKRRERKMFNFGKPSKMIVESREKCKQEEEWGQLSQDNEPGCYYD